MAALRVAALGRLAFYLTKIIFLKTLTGVHKYVLSVFIIDEISFLFVSLAILRKFKWLQKK